MDSGKGLCAQCKSNVAQLFCACSSPETFVCSICVSKHSSSNPGVEHATRPLEQLQYYKIPGYFERLRARKQSFPSVKMQVQRSAEEIDKIIAKFNAEVELIIWELSCYSKKVIAELRETKAKLSADTEKALEEVEGTLKEDQPKLSTFYGPLFRELAQTSKTAQLFTYSLKTTFTAPHSLISLQSKLYNPQDLLVRAAQLEEVKCTVMELVQVTRTFLKFFNFQTSLWDPQVPLTTQIQAYGDSSWVVLDDGRIFCCGYATAYIITRDGSVEQKDNMIEARYSHGLLHISNILYAFGGFNLGYLKTCEKFQLLGKRWTLLPSMRESRAEFNPCMLFGIVYLCGEGSFIMEAFNPETETFLPLQVTLPEDFACCLYVHNHLLVLLYLHLQV